jgi:hypothetical protein
LADEGVDVLMVVVVVAVAKNSSNIIVIIVLASGPQSVRLGALGSSDFLTEVPRNITQFS